MDTLRPNEQTERPRLTLRDMQHAVVSHSNVLGADETVDDIHLHFIEESEELAQALTTGGRKDIAGEIADIYIFLARLADQQGIDVEEAVFSKLHRNIDKYNPTRIQDMTSRGMTTAQARTTLKRQWNKADDAKYIK